MEENSRFDSPSRQAWIKTSLSSPLLSPTKVRSPYYAQKMRLKEKAKTSKYAYMIYLCCCSSSERRARLSSWCGMMIPWLVFGCALHPPLRRTATRRMTASTQKKKEKPIRAPTLNPWFGVRGRHVCQGGGWVGIWCNVIPCWPPACATFALMRLQDVAELLQSSARNTEKWGWDGRVHGSRFSKQVDNCCFEESRPFFSLFLVLRSKIQLH